MQCIKCQKEFTIQQTGSGGHNRIFCYDCVPSGLSRTERNVKRYHAMMEYSDRLKLSMGCQRCGYKTSARALEWHHPNGDKQYNPANALHISLDKYLEEIKQCELLCSNCHREEHDTNIIASTHKKGRGFDPAINVRIL